MRGGARISGLVTSSDSLGALERWVEKGIAPDKIIASHLTNGVVDRTRPLCPYPQVAQYKGKGSTNDAVNFVCVNPREFNRRAGLTAADYRIPEYMLQ